MMKGFYVQPLYGKLNRKADRTQHTVLAMSKIYDSQRIQKNIGKWKSPMG